jgi:hypothetical protein
MIGRTFDFSVLSLGYHPNLAPLTCVPVMPIAAGREFSSPSRHEQTRKRRVRPRDPLTGDGWMPLRGCAAGLTHRPERPRGEWAATGNRLKQPSNALEILSYSMQADTTLPRLNKPVIKTME